MVLYDVILAGFPEGPKIGNSEAEALSTVFGIPRRVAERMVQKVPAIVKSGVTEEVCRKYYNAFAYIGAKCEFLVTGEHSVGQDERGAEELTRPLTVSEDAPSPMRLAPTEPREITPPAPDTGSMARQVRASRAGGSSASRSVSQPIRPVRDEASARASTSAPHTAVPQEQDQTSEPPTRADAKAQSGASIRFDERLVPPDSGTAKSLPNRHLRAMLRDHPDSIDVAVRDSGTGPQPIVPDSQPIVRPFSASISAELTPPEIKDWSISNVEQEQSRTESKSGSVPPQVTPDEIPPKASILDENPAIGGSRPDVRDSLSEDDRLMLDSGSWQSDSGAVPAEFLRGGDQTGDRSAVAGTLLPLDRSPEVTVDPPGALAGPSVAEIKAAWKAGKDISLGPSIPAALPVGDDPPSLGDWDPWLDSELPDADFPSGVAVNESQDVSAIDTGQGTQLEAPATSRLMAQLEAQKRALLRLDDSLSGPRPTTEATAVQSSTSAKADSNGPLFGAPLGARSVSESGAIPKANSEIPDEIITERRRPDGPRGEPTEVPAAAMKFVRLKKPE